MVWIVALASLRIATLASLRIANSLGLAGTDAPKHVRNNIDNKMETIMTMIKRISLLKSFIGSM